MNYLSNGNIVCSLTFSDQIHAPLLTLHNRFSHHASFTNQFGFTKQKLIIINLYVPKKDESTHKIAEFEKKQMYVESEF